MFKKIAYWHFPAILWAVTILVLTSIPSLAVPTIGIDFEDKIYHFLFYFIFGLLMARAFIRHQQPRLRSGLFFSFIIGLFFSIIDEWHQKYIPGRTCDIFDALADISGILFAAIIYLLNYPFFFKNDDKMHELLLKSKIK